MHNLSYKQKNNNKLFLMVTETSFCELKGKEVINIIDGTRLGRIIDIVFDINCNRVLGFVVPSQNKSWNIFKSGEDIFIPCHDICKIGKDVILVKVYLPNIKAQNVGKTKYAKMANVDVQNQPEMQPNENILGTYKVEENIEETQK